MFTRILFLLFLSTSLSAQAQMYKWIESDGKVNYSDKPPPPSVNAIEIGSGLTSEKSGQFPYALAQAVKKMPVTLYGSDRISQSSEARNFLIKNGIPFTEKSISSNEEIDRLEKMTGSTQLPVLFIGGTKLTGYSPGEWRATLTQAGYPESNMLPSTYHFSAPQPLMPTTASRTDVRTDVNNLSPDQPKLPARDPNGFRF
jgi:glutaredoxin